MIEHTAAPRIGIWDPFDLDDYGERIEAEVLVHELRCRLPQAQITCYVPHIDDTGALDLGSSREPVRSFNSTRLAEIAATLDCVVIAGDLLDTRADAAAAAAHAPFRDGLGPVLEARVPVMWHAIRIPFDLDASAAEAVRARITHHPYLSVRDEPSLARLRQAGVTAECSVVPQAGVLVPRLFTPESLRRRLRFLRWMRWFPDGPTSMAPDAHDPGRAPARALVIQGGRELIPYVGQLATLFAACRARHPDLALVSLQLSPEKGDGAFADALRVSLGNDLYAVPASRLPIDAVAAIAHARGFVGSSVAGYATALAFGVPPLVLDLGDRQCAGEDPLLGEPQARIKDVAQLSGALERLFTGPPAARGLAAWEERWNEHFDRLAEIAARTAPTTPTTLPDDARYRALFQAHRRRALRWEREILRLEQELHLPRTPPGNAQRMLARLIASPVWRALTPIRAVARRLVR